MTARKSWVVLVDDGNLLYHDDNYRGKYYPADRQINILNVFFEERYAVNFAKTIASTYPGRDVHVYKQYRGYTAQARPVETKEWTEDGQFIPAAR